MAYVQVILVLPQNNLRNPHSMLTTRPQNLAAYQFIESDVEVANAKFLHLNLKNKERKHP